MSIDKPIQGAIKIASDYKVKVLNKWLALEYHGEGSPSVIANPYELKKQERMLESSGRVLPFPRFNYDNPFPLLEEDYNNLDCWYIATAGLKREQIEPLDFSKPYDEELIRKLHAENKTTEAQKVNICADDIINAELEGV